MGKFVVEMYDAQRPITTKNFLDLVKKKFYDKIIFHRVIDNFMIQGGDPTGTGSGGSGVIIKDELSAPNKNVQKTISMANSGPNTGQSQFFISLVDNAHLDTKHPVFGIVISNFSVVQAIGKVKTNSNNKPLTAVVMDSVRITSLPTAMNELLNDAAALEIYPNPATPESTILIDATTEKTVGISIYNQLGQVMGNQQKKLITGTNTMSLKEIQTADFSPGVYYLTVTDGSFVSRKKFVVID
jgi:peptidylprolyl isomerase